MLVVNPNNRINSPLAALEPPLWAGLIASFHNADLLDAEAFGLTPAQSEELIRDSGHKDVVIVVMGNNPSVSSTPKMPIAEELADRISDLKVSLTGLHPIAAGSKYPVISKPFEGFPMMPWDKLPMHLYRAHNWQCLDGSPRTPYASIYTSCGCPYNCYYCNVNTLYGDRRVRFRPLKDIAKELESLAKYSPIRNIKIWDELFTFQEDRVIAISEILREYKANVWAYARLGNVSENMLLAMKRGGINWLAYGFESLSDKKFVPRVEEIIKMTPHAGINIIANFMFGLPGTNDSDDQRSVEFAKKHLFEFVNFYDAKPYPGSPWHKDVKPETDWQQYSQFFQISDFRREAFRDYFTNPDYLTMLERKWGVQAVEQIKSMILYSPTMNSSTSLTMNGKYVGWSK